MNREELNGLIEKLRLGRPLLIKDFYADVEEYDRYADQLENDLNTYVDNDSFEDRHQALAVAEECAWIAREIL